MTSVPAADRRNLWYTVVGAGCLAVFLYRAISEAWVTDDALISFRYVSNLTSGNGLVYNIGERVEGFSNFLFILLLSPFKLLGLDLFAVSQVLGVLFGVAELGLLLWLGYRLGLPPIAAAFAGMLFASDRIVAVWTTGGLETSMHAALLFAAFALAIHLADRPGRGVGWVTAIHLALTASRPEGAAFYPLFLLHLYLAGRRSGDWKPQVKRSVLIFAQGLAVLLILRYAYYGTVVANTYAAKLAGVPTGKLAWIYTRGFLVRMGWISVHAVAWAAFAAAVIYGVFTTRGAATDGSTEARLTMALRSAALFVATGIAVVAYMGGDYMTDFRFYRPIMGIFYFGVGVALALVLRPGRLRVTALCLAAAAVLLASHVYRQVNPTPLADDAPPPALHKKILTVTHDRLDEFTTALEKFAQPGDKLLVDWAGFRGYGHNYYTVDATGLVSKHIGRDFYLRRAFNEHDVRERLPGHARWPKVSFMQREKFTFIFPKVSRLKPTQPEINRRAPRRHRGYPFVHVSIPHGDKYFRFFTTMTIPEVVARAHALNLEVCYRKPWGKLGCFIPNASPPQ